MLVSALQSMAIKGVSSRWPSELNPTQGDGWKLLYAGSHQLAEHAVPSCMHLICGAPVETSSVAHLHAWLRRESWLLKLDSSEL